jgi:hypothetical protein
MIARYANPPKSTQVGGGSFAGAPAVPRYGEIIDLYGLTGASTLTATGHVVTSSPGSAIPTSVDPLPPGGSSPRHWRNLAASLHPSSCRRCSVRHTQFGLTFSTCLRTVRPVMRGYSCRALRHHRRLVMRVRRNVIAGVVLVLATGLAVAPPASAAGSGPALLVDDDRAQCSGAAYTAIQPAIDAANPGETVRVCGGTYTSDLHINKAVSLVAKTPAAPAADCVTGGAARAWPGRLWSPVPFP